MKSCVVAQVRALSTSRFGRFVAIGLLQLAIDMAVFSGLVALDFPSSGANLASRFTAAWCGFWFNCVVTFRVSGDFRMLTKFWVYWAGMTAVSGVVLACVSRFLCCEIGLWFPKFITECVLFVISFLISKYWVFLHAER